MVQKKIGEPFIKDMLPTERKNNYLSEKIIIEEKEKNILLYQSRLDAGLDIWSGDGGTGYEHYIKESQRVREKLTKEVLYEKLVVEGISLRKFAMSTGRSWKTVYNYAIKFGIRVRKSG